MLLWYDSSRRRGGVCWVDEEGDEDAGSGLSRVYETEGLDLVFVEIQRTEAVTLGGFYTSKFLQTSVIAG